MKIEIKPFCREYAAELSKALNNKKILENLRDGIPYPYTVKDAEDYISFILDSNKNSVYVFAICADNKVIGTVGAFRGTNIHFRTAELGYYIAEPYWGKGIMTEAIAQICNYIFENTDIIRIFAEPFSHNIGSCQVLKKNGFICEGILRQNAVKNGKVIDMKLYSRIKE